MISSEYAVRGNGRSLLNCRSTETTRTTLVWGSGVGCNDRTLRLFNPCAFFVYFFSHASAFIFISCLDWQGFRNRSFPAF